MTLAKSKELFSSLAQTTSAWCGTPLAFTLALGMIIVWLVSGPIFRFSDTWQLVINTSTTIITFLMVFLIQSSQNRDGRLIQLKLDELIRAVDNAHTALIKMDDMNEEQLKNIQAQFAELAEEANPEEKLEIASDVLDDIKAS